jgi:spore germination protein YaaH
MVVDEASEKGRNIGHYIKGVGAYSILLGFLGIGVTISSLIWSSSNTTLQNDLRHAQEELSQSKAELSQIKTEYAQYRAQFLTSTITAKSETQSKVELPSSNISLNIPMPKSQDQVEVSVNTGKSVSFFGGDLVISLIQNSFEGDPLRHKIIATIGSPGFQNIKINRQDIGYMTTYNGKGNYEIRIMEADTFSAKFMIIRKS